MPVKFRAAPTGGSPVEISRFDAFVRKLAPIINELREERSCRSTRKLQDRLNQIGEAGRNGRPLSYGTMRRVLQRMAQLQLGPGPSSRSRAAQDRRTPYHPRLKKPVNFAGLKAASMSSGAHEAKNGELPN